MVDPFKFTEPVRKRAHVMHRDAVRRACDTLIVELEIFLDTLMEAERYRILLCPERCRTSPLESH